MEYVSKKVTYLPNWCIPIVRGFCLPYLGVFIKERYRNDLLLILHERVHLNQMQRMTFPVYLFRYVFQLVFIGYDSMPMELEARQFDTSLWNYRKRHWRSKKNPKDHNVVKVSLRKF